MASKSIGFKIAMLVGQLILACFYGLLGTILTFVTFLRLGRERFFRRVERPKPPPQALDPIYGEHGMLKLKVTLLSLMLTIFELICKCELF